jgi:hypothetical protein
VEPASLVGRARQLVIDEDDAMSDEDAIADGHSSTDKRVALDLAVGSYLHASPDLDERANPSAIPDTTAVQVGERSDMHLLAELDIVEQGGGRRFVARSTHTLMGRSHSRLWDGRIHPRWDS